VQHNLEIHHDCIPRQTCLDIQTPRRCRVTSAACAWRCAAARKAVITRRDARRLLERAERYTSSQPGFAEDLCAAALAHLR